MIRISVSDLESYRYYRDSDTSTMEDLVSRLRHTDPPTEQMGAGRALAKLFEMHAGSGVDVETVDGWTFDFSGMSGDMPLAPVRELKAEVLFQTPSGLVTLVGKVDGLSGRTVRDQKLTERWDAERYLDSLQWRSYLVMFDATEFVYDVFLRNKHNDGNRDVLIREYHPMKFFAYPGMRGDVEAAVIELARVVATYLPDLVTADARRAA